MINAFFLTEQEDIKKEIDELEADREKIKTATNNWRDKANDIFMFARYTKEDFDSDNLERKRTIIKKLGADLKLSGRTIQFTPVKYLVPIEKQYPELKTSIRLSSNRTFTKKK